MWRPANRPDLPVQPDGRLITTDRSRCRRHAEGQKSLFTEDTRFAVYMDGEAAEPTYVLEGREALTPVFADLNRYDTTTHFNGQSTVALDGDSATGESSTIAHHLYAEAEPGTSPSGI
jgi:SnoaL-like domain